MTEKNTEHKINHIVISGGGSFGFSVYATIRESYKNGIWNYEDLKTIYGTSAGAIIAVILALRYDWEIIDEFLLKRPLGAIFQINPNCFLSAFHNRGLFDKTKFYDIFAPLFGGKDIPLNITLLEFFKKTNIELHFFATEINSGNSIDVDFSYLTHPEWSLIEAVYCSSCIPGFFQPFIKDEYCFVDGGVFLNYPILPCIENVGKENQDKILGFKRQVNQQGIHRKINEETTLLDTVMIFVNKMMERALTEDKINEKIKEIPVDAMPFSVTEFFLSLNSEKERKRLFDLGVQSWQKYYEKTHLG